MSEYSLTDIVGPAMIGPSSSHTAGAARLGKIAAQLVESEIAEVKMTLHGSFAATYRGHGTDRALLAGLMMMNPDDEGLKTAPDKARARGLRFSFVCADLGDAHPNTVEFKILTKAGEEYRILGSSVGGGRVVVSEMNDLVLNFTGERAMLVTRHLDAPGVISKITALLYENQINIGNMNVSRNRAEKTAGMYMETDRPLCPEALAKIRSIKGIFDARQLMPIL